MQALVASPEWRIVKGVLLVVDADADPVQRFNDVLTMSTAVKMTVAQPFVVEFSSIAHAVYLILDLTGADVSKIYS
jgi:hypothetical protein